MALPLSLKRLLANRCSANTSCVYPVHRKKSRFKILIFSVLALVPVYHILVQPAPGQQEEQ